jgi:hypothetical protein
MGSGRSVPDDEGFRLVTWTKYPNRQDSPQVYSPQMLINFTTTDEGMTDLLPNDLIRVERRESAQAHRNHGNPIQAKILQSNTLTGARKIVADVTAQMTGLEKKECQIAFFTDRFTIVTATRNSTSEE